MGLKKLEDMLIIQAIWSKKFRKILEKQMDTSTRPLGGCRNVEYDDMQSLEQESQ